MGGGCTTRDIEEAIVPECVPYWIAFSESEDARVPVPMSVGTISVSATSWRLTWSTAPHFMQIHPCLSSL